MRDFFQLSVFYMTVSANYKLDVIDVNERNRLLLHALYMAREWCTSAQLLARYEMFLHEARSDEMIIDYQKHTLEKLAREIQMENTDFIKKMQQGIQYNADRSSDMERGIKDSMCNALSEEFQLLNSSVQKLTNDQNQLRNALRRMMQVEAGVAFASIILDAVTLGSAGSAQQGIASLTIMGQMVDFSDLAHVRKVLKSTARQAGQKK
jgi:hypothetical protein